VRENNDDNDTLSAEDTHLGDGDADADGNGNGNGNGNEVA
jgi:hypothetical protein